MLEEEVQKADSLKCSVAELVRHNIPKLKRFEYLCNHPESNCGSIRIVSESDVPLCGYWDNSVWPYF